MTVCRTQRHFGQAGLMRRKSVKMMEQGRKKRYRSTQCWSNNGPSRFLHERWHPANRWFHWKTYDPRPPWSKSPSKEVKVDIFYVTSRNKWNYRDLDDLEYARELVGFIPQDTADKFQMKCYSCGAPLEFDDNKRAEPTFAHAIL